MDNIVVQYKNGTESVHPESARDTLERVNGNEIFHIRKEGEPRKKMPGQVDTSLKLNVIAIRLIKKGLSREDIAEVLGMDITDVPDIKVSRPVKAIDPDTIEVSDYEADEKAEEVKKLKKQRKSIAQICNKTGLSKEQVEEILKTL